ncbi:MAG TPA: HEAT repeat domain-containing protein [Planctomycetota bacterium]|nr:HEAT repeat domain-containing protein [Planctomycetota bacterium]
MALLELCLVPLLLAQEPGGDPGSTTPPAEAQSAPADDPADVAALNTLCLGDDEAIAARAAWLLGNAKDARAMVLCGEVAVNSPHAEARLQAMHALLQRGGSLSMPTGIKGLEDPDRRVRTVAAQLLGKLKRPGAAIALLALIDNSRKSTDTEVATDLQAALLALNDLGSPDPLMRVATAIGDGVATGTGQALAFCFQNLSPKLDRKREVTLLVSVLDHREPLLRRYAIGRLAELDDATAVQALEARLAKEGNELRPLVEVAINQLRHDDRPKTTDELQRALANLRTLGDRASAWWHKRSKPEQWIAGSIPIALMLALLLVGTLRRRAAAHAAAAAAVAMVAPSEEYLDEMAAEADALAAESEELIDGADEQEWVEPGASRPQFHGAPRR